MTSIPASRSARAMIFAPRSCPSRPGFAMTTRILLAIATNLPEIAIVASASLSGNLGVAVGNILGGIAIQTVVLVVLDVFGVRGRPPLTYRAASLVLVLGPRWWSRSWRW